MSIEVGVLQENWLRSVLYSLEERAGGLSFRTSSLEPVQRWRQIEWSSLSIVGPRPHQQ